MEIGNRRALSDEILNDARRKAERAKKRAERRAKKIVSDAAKKADQDAEAVLGTARRRAERQATSILATVEQEARRDLLEAQEAELARLFAQALERVESRQSGDHQAVLAALAAEAIGAMDAEAVVLHLAEADLPIATPEWLGGVRQRLDRDVAIEVAQEPALVRGGVVVRSADGRLLYDNSFAARLERLRPALRRRVAASVYPSGGRVNGTTKEEPAQRPEERPEPKEQAPFPPPSGEG